MRRRLLVVMLVLSVAIVPFAVGCGANDAEKAEEVAREWTSDSMSSISKDIAALVVSGVPGVTQAAASVIEDQIKEHVAWTYSEPVESSGGVYEVKAKATASIDIPLVGSLSLIIGGDKNGGIPS